MSSSRNPSVIDDDRHVSSPFHRERIVGIHVSLLFSAFLSLCGIPFVVQIDHALSSTGTFLNDVAIDRNEIVVVFLKLCDTPSMLQISLLTAIK